MKKLFPLLVGLLLFSCDIINPDEDQPAYLVINNFTVTASAQQGGNTQKITDAWVYVNDELVGAFTMPAIIPVLVEGEQDVEIFPGIKVNGVSSIPDIYPFYERYKSTINFQPGEEMLVSPNTTYLDNTVFLMTEPFNDSAHQMLADLDENPETRIEIVSQGSLDGESGRIQLDMENNLITVGSIALTDYPETSSNFYVEMDYKTDLIMFVGLVPYDVNDQPLPPNFDQGVNPNKEWNKIYLDLSAAMSQIKQEQTIAYYRVVLTAGLAGNQDGLTEATIYVDNLKVLQF